MEEVNIFIHKPCQKTLAIAKEIRKWGTRKVRLWISEEELKEANK